MSVTVKALNVAGLVTVVFGGDITVRLSLDPGAAIEMCATVAIAAAEAELWAERVQARVDAQRALATVGCAVCASFGRTCCRDHREATS